MPDDETVQPDENTSDSAGSDQRPSADPDLSDPQKRGADSETIEKRG